jgi:transposase
MSGNVPGELAQHRKKLVPDRHPTRNNYFYDVKIDANTLDYLPCMLYMCQFLEERKEKIKGVLPLIRANIPGTVMLFTADLLNLLPEEFMVDGNGNQITKKLLREESATSKKRDAEGNLLSKGKDPEKLFTDAEWVEKEEKRISGQIKMWSTILDFSKRPLKSGPEWRFDTKMQTDGVSCSLYMEKRSIQTMKKAAKGDAFKQHEKELYVQDLSDDNKHELSGRRLISVDPGKNNIVACYENGTAVYDEENRILMDKGRTFRYTKKQRDHETNRKAYQKAAEEGKKKQPPLGGKTLQQWEEALSNFNSKTVDPGLFREYIVLVMRYKSHVKGFYSKTVFRKQRFNAYRLKQKSESNVVNNFVKKMNITDKNDVVIAFGDGARDNTKGRAPGPSTSIRKLFQRNGLKVIDVGEAWTSKRCFHCKSNDGVNEPCRKMLNTNGNPIDVWGLRRCELCYRPWSRDYHACLNIAFLALEHLQGHSRPAYLCGGTTIVRKKQNAQGDVGVRVGDVT